MKIKFEGTLEQIVEACGQFAREHMTSLKHQEEEAWKSSYIQAYMEREDEGATREELNFYIELFRSVAVASVA